MTFTLLLRRLGLGTYKDGLEVGAWSRRALNWIDNFTAYHTYKEIREILDPDFTVTHHEIDYCKFRAKNLPVVRPCVNMLLLRGMAEFLLKKWGFMVIELRKR